ncbi:MAG: LicD family protein [Eubacterium sp.]|nr:LicD family protein [Eubacterium sp.]
MNELELQKLHSLELELAKELRRICARHRIRYFMIAGTLLGAVRHGGFIPWDEDMDFGMLRADYNRFLAACETELDHGRFFLQTTDTDPAYTYAFAKLRLNGTEIVEALSQDAGAHNGIYIDIFPFDNVPDQPVLRRLHRLERYVWKNMLAVRLGYRNGQKRAAILQKMLKTAAAVLPHRFILRQKERAFVRYNGRQTKRIVTAEGSYRYDRETIPARYARKLRSLPFEDTTFPAFTEYREYLEHMYGDYMQPPPADQRDKHTVLRVDFGNCQESGSAEQGLVSRR